MPSAKPLAWYDAEEVPRAGTVSTDALARRQKIYRAWVWASIVLAPFAFLVALASAARPNAAPAQASSPGEAAATVALRSWLASKPAPLPGGRLVDWAGATTVAASSGQGGWQSEQDSFVVEGAGGRLWTAIIEVAISSGQASVVAGPSLQPVTASPGAPSTGPWPSLAATTSAPSLVVSAVSGWARAYCSGNSSELRLAVGDNNPSHVYSPLGGVVAEQVQVEWYATLPRSSNAVAQVDLWVKWAGERSMSAQPMAMDLLVARASGLAPIVVSWGPPGSGPSLKSFSPQ